MGSSILSVPILAAVLAGMIVAVIAVVRAIPPRPVLSPEERAETASAPMPLLVKRAWLGLSISTLTLVVIAVILFTKGAAAYWDNDDLRSLVVGIFLVGMLGYVFAVPVALAFDEERGRLDERDSSVLRRAATVQWRRVPLSHVRFRDTSLVVRTGAWHSARELVGGTAWLRQRSVTTSGCCGFTPTK
jgi:hypothetical protein